MLWNVFIIVFQEICCNVVCGFLIVFGVVIGVVVVVIMVSFGQGVMVFVILQVESFGSQFVMVILGSGQGFGGVFVLGFIFVDIEVVVEVVGVVVFVFVCNVWFKVVYFQEDWLIQVVGSYVDYFFVVGWMLVLGCIFNDVEVFGVCLVCVFGVMVVWEFFVWQELFGVRFCFKLMVCEVIGVLQSKGQGVMGQDQDSIVVVFFMMLQ